MVVPGAVVVVVVESVVSVLFAAAEEGSDVDVVASEGCSFWIGAPHTPSAVATEHCEVLGPVVTAPPAPLPVSATTPTTDTDRSAAAGHVKILKVEGLIWAHHRSRVEQSSTRDKSQESQREDELFAIRAFRSCDERPAARVVDPQFRTALGRSDI